MQIYKGGENGMLYKCIEGKHKIKTLILVVIALLLIASVSILKYSRFSSASLPVWLKKNAITFTYVGSHAYLLFLNKLDYIYVPNAQIMIELKKLNNTYGIAIVRVTGSNGILLVGKALINLRTRQVYDLRGNYIGITCLWLPEYVMKTKNIGSMGEILGYPLCSGCLTKNINDIKMKTLTRLITKNNCLIFTPSRLHKISLITINYERLSLNSHGKYWKVLTITNGLEALKAYFTRLDKLSNNDFVGEVKIGDKVIKGIDSVELTIFDLPLPKTRQKYFHKVLMEIYLSKNSTSKMTLLNKFLDKNPDIKTALMETKFAVILIKLNSVKYIIQLAEIEKGSYANFYQVEINPGYILYDKNNGIALTLPKCDALFAAVGIREIIGILTLRQ